MKRNRDINTDHNQPSSGPDRIPRSTVDEMISSSLDWEQVQRDFKHLIELLYGLLVRAVNSRAVQLLLPELERKLAEIPEGWRIAQVLHQQDALWGYQLESKGLPLLRLSRPRR